MFLTCDTETCDLPMGWVCISPVPIWRKVTKTQCHWPAFYQKAMPSILIYG